MNKILTIAIDFDGTIVKHRYPELGEDIPNALEVIKKLQDKGHKIILYTMRSDKEDMETLTDAVVYLKERNIKLYGINQNKSQKHWTDSSKVYANYYIDDAAIGCPLIWEEEEDKPYVNWVKIEEILIQNKIL